MVCILFNEEYKGNSKVKAGIDKDLNLEQLNLLNKISNSLDSFGTLETKIDELIKNLSSINEQFEKLLTLPDSVADFRKESADSNKITHKKLDELQELNRKQSNSLNQESERNSKIREQFENFSESYSPSTFKSIPSPKKEESWILEKILPSGEEYNFKKHPNLVYERIRKKFDYSTIQSIGRETRAVSWKPLNKWKAWARHYLYHLPLIIYHLSIGKLLSKLRLSKRYCIIYYGKWY